MGIGADPQPGSPQGVRGTYPNISDTLAQILQRPLGEGVTQCDTLSSFALHRKPEGLKDEQ
jgi:hypothetical protein